jgi:hypothetical protein
LPQIKIAAMHRAGPPISAMNTKKVLIAIVSSLLSIRVLYKQTNNPSTNRVIGTVAGSQVLDSTPPPQS